MSGNTYLEENADELQKHGEEKRAHELGGVRELYDS